jgi:hypothetical protein
MGRCGQDREGRVALNAMPKNGIAARSLRQILRRAKSARLRMTRC